MEEVERLIESLVGCFVIDQPAYIMEDANVQYQSTDLEELNLIYQYLPGKFPNLFEELIMSYRWGYLADVGILSFYPNPPGKGFEGLRQAIFEDKNLSQICLENGYIPFGRGPNFVYDPICFEVGKSKEPRIVRLEHESILIHSKIHRPIEIASNFRDLISKVLSSKK